MKGFISACLLLTLQFMSPAHGFEADIHYSTTYVLARAVGWTQADALTIASANEGVDENQHTVAALEMEPGNVANSLRQAEKNLRLHCFSKTHGQAGEIAGDVVEVVSRHFAEVPDHAEDPRSNAGRLIALGVALHCLQDARSHAGFGGSCGPYPGSCYGHTHQTVFDQVVFGLLGKHYFNPDHPGVSGERLLETLDATVSELAAHGPKGSSRSIPVHELVALSDALRNSGLELPDEVRQECNRYIAGKWLFDFFHSGNRAQDNAGELETLGPEVASACKNASLGSATVLSVPDPRFPLFNADASPSLVRADGTYQLVHDQVADASSTGIKPNYASHGVKVQLSHWRQILALPLVSRVGAGQ
jgi:hypothetical protein